MKKLLLVLGWCAAVIGLASCARWVRQQELQRVDERDTELSSVTSLAADVSRALDPSARPCDDFFQYACGGWLAGRETSGTGRGSGEVQKRINLRLRGLFEELAGADPVAEAPARLRDFHRSAIKPRPNKDTLKPVLNRIDDVVDEASLMRVMGELHGFGVPGFFSVSAQPGLADPSRYGLWIEPGNLGPLTDPRVYTADDPEYTEVRAWARARLRACLTSDDEAESHAVGADEVFQFAAKLAGRYPTYRDMRNAPEYFRSMTVDELGRRTKLPWAAYFQALGVPETNAVTVLGVSYLEALARLVREADWPIVRQYLRAQVRWEYFDALEPLRTMVPTVDGEAMAALPTSVARLYLSRYPIVDRVAPAGHLFETVRSAVRERLLKFQWLDRETRASLADKIDAIEPLVGQPARWEDDPEFPVGADDYIENMINARHARHQRDMARLGLPFDRPSWPGSPLFVNAFYFPTTNRVIVGLGLVMTPFFDPSYPAAVNFGAFGRIVGHEIGHGLDSKGRWFGPHGEQVAAWPDSTAAALSQRLTCLGDHYRKFEAASRTYSRLGARFVESAPVDAELTADENIADIIGLKAAYDGMVRTDAERRADEQVFAGLGRDQLFFVSFAQSTCEEVAGFSAHVVAAYDVHTPSRARVNAAVSQMPEFQRAFQCQQQDKLFSPEVCLE